MKSTAVDESLSSMNQQFCSRENQLLQMLQQNEKSTQKNDNSKINKKFKINVHHNNNINLEISQFIAGMKMEG